jgi:hypothetical protein
MRTIFVLCGLILVLGGGFLWRTMQLPNHFGEFSGAPVVTVEELIARPEAFLGEIIAVRGNVREQCRTMGCFFFFHAANGKLRVELQDIAMDAPMREGRPARVEGQIVKYADGYQLYATAVAFE